VRGLVDVVTENDLRQAVQCFGTIKQVILSVHIATTIIIIVVLVFFTRLMVFIVVYNQSERLDSVIDI